MCSPLVCGAPPQWHVSPTAREVVERLRPQLLQLRGDREALEEELRAPPAPGAAAWGGRPGAAGAADGCGPLAEVPGRPPVARDCEWCPWPPRRGDALAEALRAQVAQGDEELRLLRGELSAATEDARAARAEEARLEAAAQQDARDEDALWGRLRRSEARRAALEAEAAALGARLSPRPEAAAAALGAPLWDDGCPRAIAAREQGSRASMVGAK
ncbi:unnamed protein product, partial [Prorocentrum cordatum]